MEHRWGRRIPVKIPVRLILESGESIIGETENVSFSGALIQTAGSVRLFSRLQVEVILPREIGGGVERVSAHVTRKMTDCAAIEWCDFAPRGVRALLRALDPLAARALSRDRPHDRV